MKVAALIVGEPRGPELWTPRKISSAPCEAHVVQALHKSVVPSGKLLRSRIREFGFFATASGWLGKRLIGAREEKNIRHSRAPLIRRVSSIPWRIIENRPEWIGATMHLIDKGIDTGAVLWRGAPQLTPGDINRLARPRSRFETEKLPRPKRRFE